MVLNLELLRRRSKLDGPGEAPGMDQVAPVFGLEVTDPPASL
jgi:hypothetical protein